MEIKVLYNKKNKLDTCIYYFELMIFFIFLLLQYKNVYMYFDDYGYVTLSYAVQLPGIEGTSYSLAQIIEFLKLHYLGWGGRLFTYFLDIILLKNNIWIARIFMAAIVCGLFHLIHFIVIKSTGQKILLSFSGILTFSFFGFIQINILRDSFYWFIAAMTYIVPVILFLGGFTLYYKINQRKNRVSIFPKIIIFIAFVLLSSSQEQLGGAMLITYILMLCMKKFYFKNKIEVFDVITLFGISVSFFFLVCSPGNRLRMSITETSSFMSLSFFEKIFVNIGELTKIFFSNNFFFFLLILLVSSGFICIILIKKSWGVKPINYLFFLINSMLLLLVVLTKGEVYSVTQNLDYLMILDIVLIVFIILDVFQIMAYYFIQRKFMIAIPFIFAFVSVGALVISPALTLRSFVPFIILYFLIALDIFIEIVSLVKKKTLQFGLVSIVLVIAVSFNILPIYLGYKDNSICLKYNEEILAKAKNESNYNEQPVIYLSKLKNDLYGYVMPYYYDNGVSHAMKIYYGLPEDISFEWVEPEAIFGFK